jgi:hypothetical protein
MDVLFNVHGRMRTYIFIWNFNKYTMKKSDWEKQISLPLHPNINCSGR